MPIPKLSNPELPGREEQKALMRRAVLAAITIACSAVASPVFSGSEKDLTYLGQPTLDGRKLPFSEAVRVGNLLFLSGQIGLNPETGKLVAGGVQPETRQTLENIMATLDRYGSSMSQVIKCTIFLADIAEWASMNEVYVEFFPVKPPARSALGTSGLALGARTEIECLAYVDADSVGSKD